MISARSPATGRPQNIEFTGIRLVGAATGGDVGRIRRIEGQITLFAAAQHVEGIRHIGAVALGA
jgi:hypothetical protein